MPVFVAPVPHSGLLRKGTIDLTKRPIVRVGGGKIATVESVSFHLKPGEMGLKQGGEILLPGVIGNHVYTCRRDGDSGCGVIWGTFQSTGQHLGVFDTVAHCNAYAVALHKWQAKYYWSLIRQGKRRVGSRG